MKTSTPSRILWTPPPKSTLARLELTIRQARNNAIAFVAGGFRDTTGKLLAMAPVHSDLQAFLTRAPMALVELPRDHGKSTQVCARILWELGRQPGLRIKVVCATEALAIERVRFIRDALDTNLWVRAVFPHLVKQVPWQAGAFTIRRPATIIGPSVSAVGVKGGSTGARADLLVCDDIVDVTSLSSMNERERVASLFRENLMNLLEPNGRCWCLFTAWHRDDLNAQLKVNAAFRLFRRAVGPNLEPVWPDKWPTEKLAERLKQIGEKSFNRGYRLLATDESDFTISTDWVKFWTVPQTVFDTILLAVDPAVSIRQTADRSALVVLGRKDEKIYCLYAEAKRYTMPQLFDAMESLNTIWNPSEILFESNAAFQGVKQLITKQERYGYKLVAVNAKETKESRVLALGRCFCNDLVFLKSGPGGPAPEQQELYDEIISFPHARHDDLVDALAMGVSRLVNTKELDIR